MEPDSISWTDDCLCLAHISDPHLLRRVEEHARAGTCEVCVQLGLTPTGPVVNLSRLARVVEEAAQGTYDHEGFFADGEQVMDPLDDYQVVDGLLARSLQSVVADRVVEMISELFERLDWFETYDTDSNAGLDFEWGDFEQSVKHESRLLSAPAGEEAETAPERNFEFVRSLLVFTQERADLVTTLEQGTKLFRARTARDARDLQRRARADPAVELGPAPPDRVTAGRMNAQGVPLLYVARDPLTAAAEVASHSPYDDVVVGAFELQQPLRVLDFTRIPPPRSPFDDTYVEGDERLAALGFYVDQVTRAVILDEQHPVDYVPTQILTEAFRWWSNPRLDGIAYPSLVRDGGTNLVLFFGHARWFEEEGGTETSRITGHQRKDERGNPHAVFTISPSTVQRYRVSRAMSVDPTIW